MQLNERIKACRQRCGLTQEQVAEALDVSRQAVTKWENGQSSPSTDNLFRLAALFGTTVDLILPKEYSKMLDHKEESGTSVPDQQPQKASSRKRNMVKMVLFAAVWQVLIIACSFTLVAFDVISMWEANYLFSWVMSIQSLLIVFVITIVLSLVGWNRMVYSLSAGHLFGLIFAAMAAPKPYGPIIGMENDSLSYLLFFVLVGLLAGLLLEYKYVRKLRKNIVKST